MPAWRPAQTSLQGLGQLGSSTSGPSPVPRVLYFSPAAVQGPPSRPTGAHGPSSVHLQYPQTEEPHKVGNERGWPGGQLAQRKRSLKLQREKNSRGRRKGCQGWGDTELLYSEEAVCVGESSRQPDLLFILLLWVAGPQAREVISGKDHSTLISY